MRHEKPFRADPTPVTARNSHKLVRIWPYLSKNRVQKRPVIGTKFGHSDNIGNPGKRKQINAHGNSNNTTHVYAENRALHSCPGQL
jgi:hypothetical protein